MKAKRILKIIAWVLGILGVIIISIVGFVYIKFHDQLEKDLEKYPNYIGYINPDKAHLNEAFELCDNGRIYGTHHGLPKEAFAISKKHFRNTILSEYKSESYSDSGYLNFRFLVNCEGKAGRFEINELNLDLEEIDLNDQMVKELLNLTALETHWATFYINGEPKNYYMYILYRIENGKIIEILP